MSSSRQDHITTPASKAPGIISPHKPAKAPGQIAYEAFANSRTFPRLPVWDSLTDCYRASWAVVECAVAEPLIDTLSKLTAEVAGMIGIEEPALRQLLGNTNFSCLQRRWLESRDVIARYKGGAA